jgi:hypothetical protein
MNFRLIQLHDVIFTPYNTVNTEVVETNNGIIESSIKRGGRVYDNKPRLQTREIIIQASYIQSDDGSKTPYDRSSPYTWVKYFNKLKKLQQMYVRAYFVGQDDKIYSCMVKTTIVTAVETTVDNYQFQLNLYAPDVYLIDITNFLFERVYLEERLKTYVRRYKKGITYLKNTAHFFALEYAELPNCIQTSWYPIPGTSISTTIIDTSDYLVLDDGSVDGMVLDDNSADGMVLAFNFTNDYLVLDDGSVDGMVLDDGSVDGMVLILNEGTSGGQSVVTTATNLLAEYLTPISENKHTIINETGHMQVFIIAYYPSIGNNSISINNKKYNLKNYQYFTLTSDGAYMGTSLTNMQRYDTSENIFDSQVDLISISEGAKYVYNSKNNIII